VTVFVNKQICLSNIREHEMSRGNVYELKEIAVARDWWNGFVVTAFMNKQIFPVRIHNQTDLPCLVLLATSSSVTENTINITGPLIL
jgi:hypothetical protein